MITVTDITVSVKAPRSAKRFLALVADAKSMGGSSLESDYVWYTWYIKKYPGLYDLKRRIKYKFNNYEKAKEFDERWG